MKIACLQLNATVGDFAGNLRKLATAYRRAVERGAELALAPELFVTGYPPRDLLLHEDFLDASDAANDAVAAMTGAVPLVCGILTRNPARPGKPLFNSAGFFHAGKLLTVTHKCLLPTYDVFDEDRYFEPGKVCEPFVWNGMRLGLTICEDIWNDVNFWFDERLYAVDPVRELSGKNIDLLLNISASPWEQGKEWLRARMLQKIAGTAGVPLVLVNMVGANDELVFDGHSLACNAGGELLARGRSFAEDLLVVDVGAWSAAAVAAFPRREEQLFSALSLGVRDYAQKTGFDQVTLGLSGGIDSALVAVIAVDALGPDQVLGVLMPGRYSSAGSVSDAELLAQKLAIEYQILPIKDSFQALLRHLDSILGGTAPDQTEENLQSRLRGLTLMAIANKTGRLVLTTGNKSEFATGYCTLYGDMCGALGVIGDVSKTEVYRLARWINRHGEIIPRASIEKPPSAELRPGQTDQDTLPPYEELDGILELYVVQGKSIPTIVSAGYDERQARDLIRKFDLNEYKRRQAAPSLKVSARAFGTGRRMPIAQRFRHGG
ncbi:MAG: NAD+ synthase [Verrucomicrobiales bacterium]|jgi:NAD+ synthetase|nr:NAD+ synthase [Verrucomicrobiales bacterium]